MVRPRKISDDAILAAASRLFLRDGPGTSLDTIGAELGVTGAALLRRFGSKKQLLARALIPDELTDWGALIDGVKTSSDVFESLVAISSAVSEVLCRIVAGSEVLRAAGFKMSDVWEEQHPAPPERATRALAKWLQTHHRAGHLHAPKPHSSARVLLALLQYRALLARAGLGSAGTRKTLQSDLRAFWEGLAPPTSRSKT